MSRPPRSSDKSHADELPPDWDSSLRDLRKRMKWRMKQAEKLMFVFGGGMFLFGFGLLFLPVLLNAVVGDALPWFGLCFAMTFVSGLGMGINLVRFKQLEQQVDEGFVFGGRSLGSGRNRVLLQSNPGFLHVRLSGVFSSFLLLAVLAGIGFMVVAIAALFDATYMIRNRHGSEVAPAWTMGVVFAIGGIAFGSVGLLPLLSAWRFDFDRRKSSVRIWNWFRKYELPLSMFERVESEHREDHVEIKDSKGRGTGRYRTVRYRSINLCIRDKAKSRLHVMCDNSNGNAAVTLREFVFPGKDQKRGDAPKRSEDRSNERRKPAILRPTSSMLPNLRRRNIAIVTIVLIVGVAGSLGGYSIFRRVVPPPIDRGELERMVGRWHGEIIGIDESRRVVKRDAEMVTDGHFLRVIETQSSPAMEDSLVVKAVMYWTYDATLDRYRMWRFSSRGAAMRFEGSWDDGKQQFDLYSDVSDQKQRVVVKCGTGGHIESELEILGGERKITFHMKLDRKNDIDVQSQWGANDEPQRLTNGMKFLVKHAGHWKRREFVQSEAKWYDYDESSTWVLGGKFLETERMSSESAQRQYSIAMHDESSEKLRYWNFGRNGHVSELDGEYKHLAYVPWTPANAETTATAQWNFGTDTTCMETWRWRGERGKWNVVTANLRRQETSPVTEFPLYLKSRVPVVRRRETSRTFPALYPPKGPNLLLNASSESTEGGGNPDAALDGDDTTSWTAGRKLNAELEGEVTIRRIVIRHPKDRLYGFRITTGDTSEKATYVHARLYRNLGQLNQGGETTAFRSVAGMVYVNGQPLEVYTSNRDVGVEALSMIEYQFLLPEPVTTSQVGLIIDEACASPVLIAEFEAYAD
ncbi:discoidin domain-containing protein [Bremerella sp. P1]|uniref:discoidin domain-containing protein n=1 Tax=Bremerella sp. P1 TaxID=3026424 RepID=UPI00236843C8|nr:discoidin domain-containing protein [Bremerella sp. P1]WDI41990.1 discoidin domain-containing protein [Bremerella sp. P1]